MPYIVSVTTWRPSQWFEGVPGGSTHIRYETTRKAVATLDEARRHTYLTVMGYGWPRTNVSAWDKAEDQAKQLRENSGPITLPDGTIIEVESVSWADLAESVNWLGRGYVTEAEWPEVIDAYNNR
jgi:hypothetical protein